MESKYEIAVYLHSFLNLDLFSQGFYAIKIRCRVDDQHAQNAVLGVPARVVQYGQVEDADPGRVADAVWRLEEKDKSFTSRIFWIKYARQDVPLQEMVAFDLVVPEAHGPPACGFVIDFDLLHGTANKELPQGVGTLQPPNDLPLVASQSFRIVPAACTGLHSYCAVQFDTLHLSLLDATIHCTLLDIQNTAPCGGDSVEHWNGVDPSSRGQSPEASLRSRVRALLANPSEAASPEPHEGSPAQSVSPTGVTPRSKHPPMSKTLDSMLSSVLPPSMLSPKNAEPAADVPLKSWRRKKPKAPPEADPPEVDYAAALERWSEARDKLQVDLDELRRLLMDHGVSMKSSGRSPRTGGRTGGWNAEAGATTAWEWSARVMRKFVRGLWNEFLELHREQPRVITEHLRTRWRDARATEWAFWTVNPDAPLSPAGSFLALRAEYEQRGRKGRSRLGPSDVLSARAAEAHRKGIGDGTGCLLQDLSLYQHPERHPILSTERHVAGQHRYTSLSHYRPPLAALETSPSSSPWSFRSTPLDSPADLSPTSSPPPEDTPRMSRLSLPPGVAYGNGNMELPPSVQRFLAETPPVESYEMLVQEMARVSPPGVHVVVFVHGFQGHHLDLRLVRDHWLVLDPSIEPLMSHANQDLTFEPIQDMGARLALEVAEFLDALFGKPARTHGRSTLSKLSFVGHSLGNLIVRSALTHPALEPFLGRLHTCLSISGPHLGYLYSGNALFNSGLWFMKRFKNSACMHQLTFSDRENVQECYLFQLNQARTLDLFKNVILVASPQDRYVPYHSARVEMCSAAIKDLKRGPAYAAMIMGCLGKLTGATGDAEGLERSQTLLRCDVNFDTAASGRTFSSMLGRTAHIELLENDVYIRCLLWTHKDCFL
ncbi:hypothetical protein KFL_000880160 [Klebsormidium nitens]|uniref:DUF676 domain-containing protein n=1 Tax=Klebsormidium nitens TaxID=105231 RepID=A0A1Y1HV77_KLENI|nr:hypothetical protein KFL_000880160 [Klebsormidium nitens]|eukprot:GAQ81702.1 hypothetical protein KFL_000880160 [Klebsormidium nitens]